MFVKPKYSLGFTNSPLLTRGLVAQSGRVTVLYF